MTYSDIRARARESLRGNWGISIGTAFVAALLGGIIAGSGWNFEINTDIEMIQKLPPAVISFLTAWAGAASLLSLGQFIVGGAVQLGYARFLLNQHDRRDFEFNDLFSQFHRFGQGFAQKFLRGLYTILWSLLLVIPGIIKAFSYAMTPYIMADHPEMSAKAAMKYSQELMDGHKGELFMLGLTFIGWEFLACLSLGIGFFWLNPYMNAAYTAFYRELTGGPRYIAE